MASKKQYLIRLATTGAAIALFVGAMQLAPPAFQEFVGASKAQAQGSGGSGSGGSGSGSSGAGAGSAGSASSGSGTGGDASGAPGGTGGSGTGGATSGDPKMGSERGNCSPGERLAGKCPKGTTQ